MKMFVFVWVLLAVLWMLSKRRRKHEWLPEEFYAGVDPLSECSELVFSSGAEIPTGVPTLLIIGSPYTRDRSIMVFDRAMNFLTFGWLRFCEIYPVGQPLGLRLYFENISTSDLPIVSSQLRFLIRYPGEPTPSRNWQMTIPTLKIPGEKCTVVSKRFFVPEMPGIHEFYIEGIPNVCLAGPYGICGRKYRIPASGDMWRLPFHVSAEYEYKTFIVVVLTLAVALLTFLATL